jgi:predicted enzyme related to lactoylglutathione lyase
MHAKNDEGASQWAVLVDPNAAAFGIIPVVPAQAIPSSISAGLPDEAAVGRICWLNLTVPDASATLEFYRQVVGWSVQHVDMEDDGECYADYNLLRYDGNPVGALCHARGVNLGLPPVWIIHLAVADLAQSLRRVKDEGGKIVKRMQGKDGEIAYATVQDPVGAYVALAAMGSG